MPALPKVPVLGLTHTHTQMSSHIQTERDSSCGLSWAHRHCRALGQLQCPVIHFVRELIGQCNWTMCVAIYLSICTSQLIFFKWKCNAFFLCKSRSETSEHDLALTYVPCRVSACFDVQAITDHPYRYLTETEYFQFLKCEPSFFFSFFLV